MEIFGGYSFIRPDVPGSLAPDGSDKTIQSLLGNVLGWSSNATINLNRFFGLTGEISAYYKNFDISIPDLAAKANLNLYTFLGGPTFKARKGAFEPFGHVLVGAGRPGANIGDSTDFHETGLVIAGGGGLDVVVNDRLGIRAIQADYFPYRTSSGDTFTFNNIRWSTGILFRFGH